MPLTYATNLLLAYATRDGQARRITARIADRLGDRGIVVSPQDLAGSPPTPTAPATSGLVVVVAAVRYGRHLPEADRFLAAWDKSASPASLVFVSVNLTARKLGKHTAEGNRYLRNAIVRHRLRPALAIAVAGRLDYACCRWFDRHAIRLIMLLTGGPTDLRGCVEFTDWDAVDAIADQVAALHQERTRRP